MNILIISEFPIPHVGGLSTHVEDLIACLKCDGHEVNLIEGTVVNICKFRRLVYVILCGGKNDNYRNFVVRAAIRRMVKKVKRFLENNHVDIIHCHDPIAGYATHLALAKVDLDIPVIETIHGPLAYEAKMMMGKEINQSNYLKQLLEIEKRAFLKAKHLIAVDTGQARIAIEDFEIDHAKVSVIFNAVSCEAIDSIVKAESSIKLNKPYLLVPRRLVRKTGVHIAIEALAQLDSDINVNLVIAGDGVLRNELEQLARKLGVGPRVTFLGLVPRKEVLRIAKGALAVLVPSIPSDGVVEASSIAALEAMACGTVVIASNIGGLAELIQHNQTGFLVPHSNPQALSTIIAQVYKEPDFRGIVCHKAQQYVLENLDTSIWCNKIERVYEDALRD